MMVDTLLLQSLQHWSAKRVSNAMMALSITLPIELPLSHPLYQSIQLARATNRPPILTIAKLASLWHWKNGPYTPRRVRQRLQKTNIRIYNQHVKGFVFLSDLAGIRNISP